MPFGRGRKVGSGMVGICFEAARELLYGAKLGLWLDVSMPISYVFHPRPVYRSILELATDLPIIMSLLII